MALPLFHSTAQARSDALVSLIRQEIEKSDGFISFARFMELALYAPRLGYYAANTIPFGQEGDFITAPHISPLFTRCFARAFEPILARLSSSFLLEIGAGSGRFAMDCLLELEKRKSLPEHYYILEISDALRNAQHALFEKECPHLLSRVTWLDALPDEFVGIIFANEVLDALPVTCFQVEKNHFAERSVTWEKQFAWRSTTPSLSLQKKLDALQKEIIFPENYRSEIHLSLTAFLHSLSNHLKEGVIFLSDYGYGRRDYYHPDRSEGTLMCYFQHQRHDNPFVQLGLQDITAHVDFTAVAEESVEAGLELAGFTTQQAFLFSHGILENEKSLPALDHYTHSQAIKKLILPSEMGEAVKVMALTKRVNFPLDGFSLQDRRHDL